MSLDRGNSKVRWQLFGSRPAFDELWRPSLHREAISDLRSDESVSALINASSWAIHQATERAPIVRAPSVSVSGSILLIVSTCFCNLLEIVQRTKKTNRYDEAH